MNTCGGSESRLAFHIPILCTVLRGKLSHIVSQLLKFIMEIVFIGLTILFSTLKNQENENSNIGSS